MNDIKFKAYLKLTNETVDVQKIDIENKQISFYKNNDDGYLYVCDFKNIEFIFNQQDIRQQLDESFTEEDVEGLIEDRDKTIKFLQQKLAEKDCRIEELEGQFTYECECNKQLVEVQKQLEKKQNEIDEINKEFVQAVHDWKVLCAEKDKEISKLQASCQQVKTQLAIAELEKVKEWLEPKYFDYEQINYLTRIIDNQIKELKGE